MTSTVSAAAAAPVFVFPEDPLNITAEKFVSAVGQEDLEWAKELVESVSPSQKKEFIRFLQSKKIEIYREVFLQKAMASNDDYEDVVLTFIQAKPNEDIRFYARCLDGAIDNFKPQIVRHICTTYPEAVQTRASQNSGMLVTRGNILEDLIRDKVSGSKRHYYPITYIDLKSILIHQERAKSLVKTVETVSSIYPLSALDMGDGSLVPLELAKCCVHYFGKESETHKITMRLFLVGLEVIRTSDNPSSPALRKFVKNSLFEKHVLEIVFQFLSETRANQHLYSQIHGIMNKALMSELSNYADKIIEAVFSNDDGVELRWKEVKDIFNELNIYHKIILSEILTTQIVKRNLNKEVISKELWARGITYGATSLLDPKLFFEQALGLVLKNKKEALRLMELAAEQGHEEAQFHAGRMYLAGDGVGQDKAKALQLFEQAATQGHAEAQFYAGSMYSNGDGVEQDQAKAVQLLEQAAEQGYAMAQYGAGCAYFYGNGVEQDKIKALRLLARALEQRDANLVEYANVQFFGEALVAAAKQGDAAVVQLLIQNEQFPEITKVLLGIALIHAAKQRATDVVRLLIQSKRFPEIDASDLGGALVHAAGESCADVVQLLIQNERFPEIDASDLGSALLRAAGEGYEDVVQQLILSGRLHEIGAKKIGDALTLAAGKGHESIVKLISAFARSVRKTPAFVSTT